MDRSLQVLSSLHRGPPIDGFTLKATLFKVHFNYLAQATLFKVHFNYLAHPFSKSFQATHLHKPV